MYESHSQAGVNANITLLHAKQYLKNPGYKTTTRPGRIFTIGTRLALICSPVQRSLAISIDSACFYYPENNQPIVYTHYVDLSRLLDALYGRKPFLHRNGAE